MYMTGNDKQGKDAQTDLDVLGTKLQIQLQFSIQSKYMISHNQIFVQTS